MSSAPKRRRVSAKGALRAAAVASSLAPGRSELLSPTPAGLRPLPSPSILPCVVLFVLGLFALGLAVVFGLFALGLLQEAVLLAGGAVRARPHAGAMAGCVVLFVLRSLFGVVWGRALCVCGGVGG